MTVYQLKAVGTNAVWEHKDCISSRKVFSRYDDAVNYRETFFNKVTKPERNSDTNYLKDVTIFIVKLELIDIEK